MTFTEIGLAVCDRCGHGRSEHGYCNEMYPAMCSHMCSDRVGEDGWPDVCMCLEFVAPEGGNDA